MDSAAEQPHVILHRSQLEEWAGRTLTDDEVDAIALAIPRSSIPSAIETIANEGIFCERRTRAIMKPQQ
ncbi:hypothetical protein [Mycobacterium sp.]|uniref:hypothetical protein n=1 Tax=Mycobacterium sp. TaxID=1785 RepID=UPI0025D11AA6|nr:hypothetical protein [Mycobacterium sp.]